MDRIQSMGVLVCLSVLARQDARDGEVDGRWIAAMAVCGILPQIAGGPTSAIGGLTGLFPGILLWGISVLTREAVGAGDALSLWALGFSRDGIFCLGILTDSLWMTAGCALWGRGMGLRERIPWIPFLWLAYLLNLAAGAG